MKTLKDFDLKEKKVLVRCDLNVPIDEKGSVSAGLRIKAVLPTIEYLLEKRAKIILMSHLGRPEGKFVKKLSLKPIALRLEKLLKEKIGQSQNSKPVKVKFLDDFFQEKNEKEFGKMKKGDIFLLENLRFYKEEKENNQKFAEFLSKMGDIFINDAFSVCHRAHASVVGITKHLPSGAGFLLEKEIKNLSRVMKNPERPLIIIIGGKKVEDKAKVVEIFSEIADYLLTGTLVSQEIKKGKLKIKYPEKIFFGADAEGTFDMEENSVNFFKEKIKKAKTIFWAGPLGKVEEKRWQKGTKEIARAIIESRAFSVIGGGETIEFIEKIKLTEKFNHVSTGGGAMLKFLADEKMPGLEALKYGN